MAISSDDKELWPPPKKNKKKQNIILRKGNLDLSCGPFY